MSDVEPQNWKAEAEAVVRDIKSHVQAAKVSSVLDSSEHGIYLNLTTLESKNYCIELSASGFRVAGFGFDMTDIEGGDCFETPYSLLNSISPQFHNSFGNALLMKLNNLSEEQR